MTASEAAPDNETSSNAGTPSKKRRRSSDSGNSGPIAIKMQNDVLRVSGLDASLQQQITKFDSSEFDVSFLPFLMMMKIIQA